MFQLSVSTGVFSKKALPRLLKSILQRYMRKGGRYKKMALLNYYEILTKTLQNCFQNINFDTHQHPIPNEHQQFGRARKVYCR